LTDEIRSLQLRISKIKEQLAALDQKRTVLSALLERLERKLHNSGSPTSEESKRTDDPRDFFADKNISLFASLFRCREDVYAKRRESRAGKSGFTPVCRHEWARGICAKPRVKYADCSHREFIPLTPDIFRQHLIGNVTVGVYPLLKDQTCHFLAVDFDKASWMEDVAAFKDICNWRGVTHAVERSRSGNGAHVWFFFESPMSARLARGFGCALLTQTMERRHRLGLDSYDRLFPNQDTLPKGGFGGLIALPLQPVPARSGNSLFVDSAFKPYTDQWTFLKSVKKLPGTLVKTIEQEASRKGKIVGVRLCLNEDTGDQPWNSSQPDGTSGKGLTIHA